MQKVKILTGIRTLITDDIPEARESLKKLLAFEPDFDVIGLASTGREALEMCNELFPDVVLMDINMPDMDGITACNELRKTMPEIGVVMMSVQGEAEYIRRAMAAGARDFLTKPPPADELYATVRRVFEIQKQTFGTFSLRPKLIRPGHALIIGSISDNMFHRMYKELRWVCRECALALPEEALEAVATFVPGVIVTPESDLLPVLRQFELSAYIPIVYLANSSISIYQAITLYTAGADEICAPNKLLDAIQTALARYEAPILDDMHAFKLLIATNDDSLYRRFDLWFRSRFKVTVSNVATMPLCLQSATKDNPNLVVLDADLPESPPDSVKYVRKQGYRGPLILVLDEAEAASKEYRYQYTIQGYLTKQAVSNQDTQSLFERLRRFRRSLRSLDLIWAEYSVAQSELNFELWIRKRLSVLASMMAESGSLYSGLIHDLRNVLLSFTAQIKTQERKVTDQTTRGILGTIGMHAQCASFWLEAFATMRFKGNWAPTLHPSENDASTYLDIVERGLSLAKLMLPNVDFRVQNTLEGTFSTPAVYADENQLRLVLVALFVAIGIMCSDQKVDIRIHTVSNNLRLNVAGKTILASNLEHVFQPEQAKAGRLEALLLFVARKLTARHSGFLRVEQSDLYGDSLLFSLPIYEQVGERTLREQIGTLAASIEQLRIQREKSPSLLPIGSIAPLINAPSKALIATLEQIRTLSEQLGPVGRRLRLNASYAILLTRDMIITTAGLPIQPKPIKLDFIFDLLIQLRENYLKDCEVTKQVIPGTPPVFAEELGLLQILINLVNNAVEAMNGEGKLTVQAQPHPEGVQIEVSDTGCGILPEHRGKIFDLFFSTKTGHERGVGLHIVRSVVRQMGGRITVESTPGKGTTFKVILRAAPDAAAL